MKMTQGHRTLLVSLLLAGPLTMAMHSRRRRRRNRRSRRRPPPGRLAPKSPWSRSERARCTSATNRRTYRPATASATSSKQKEIDATYAARSQGVMAYQKIRYVSPIDGLEIQAHLFSPLQKRGPRGHAAMVWVHGGVHGSWGTNMFPFVREAVQRGYVIITPDYRGSTGYGEAFYKKIDYGGKEIDDVIAAYDYLKTLPEVDPERVGIMGWSHGGFITSHVLFREQHPFKSGAAIVPVTNLVFRLSYKGPGYQRDYGPEEGLLGLPFEKRAEYIKRSPVFHVGNLKVPMLVPRRHQRRGRELRRGPADDLHAHGAEADPGRDQNLRRSGPGAGFRRPHVQPKGRSADTRARRFTGPDRFMESDVGVLRAHAASGRRARVAAVATLGTPAN